MDWNAISDQLAGGQKHYEMFKEGAELAARLASFERFNRELQAQADALPPQIEALKAEIVVVEKQAEQARSDAAARGAAQLRDIAEASRKRSEEAQASLAIGETRLAAQAKEHDVRALAHKEVLARLQASADQLKDQIASLEQIKAALKSQLQGVA